VGINAQNVRRERPKKELGFFENKSLGKILTSFGILWRWATLENQLETMSQHDAADDDGSMLAAAAWDSFLRSYFASDDSHTPRRPAGALGDTGAEVDVTVGLITTQPIWRRKELLAELENFVGPLSEKERELVDAEVDGNMGSGDDFDESVSPLSTMMNEFADALEKATESKAKEEVLRASLLQEVGGAASVLASAFRGAAKWEQKLAPLLTIDKDEHRAPQIHAKAVELRAQLTDLPVGELMLFPGGFAHWPDPAKGRSFTLVLLVIQRESDSHFSMTLINTGDGAFQYHPSTDAVPPSVRLRPCVHLEHIASEKLEDAAVCWMLVQLRTKPVSYDLTVNSKAYLCAESAEFSIRPVSPLDPRPSTRYPRCTPLLSVDLRNPMLADFYECFVPHLLPPGTTLRAAFDHTPIHEWCTAEMVRFAEDASVNQATVVAALNCLLDRPVNLSPEARQVLARLSATLVVRLQQQTLVAVEADVDKLLADKLLVVESDVLTIELITQRALAKTLDTFPIQASSSSSAAAGGGMASEVHKEVHERIANIRSKAGQLRAGRIVDGRASAIERLDVPPLMPTDEFHRFLGFELLVDVLPFEQMKEAARTSTTVLLDLHRGFLAESPIPSARRWERFPDGTMPDPEQELPVERPHWGALASRLSSQTNFSAEELEEIRVEHAPSESFEARSFHYLNVNGVYYRPAGRLRSIAKLAKAIELIVVICDELRQGSHGLEELAATHMVEALIEHSVCHLLPLPLPWRIGGGSKNDLYNPTSGATAAGLGEATAPSERNHFTRYEQQLLLAQLQALTEHYLAALFTSQVQQHERTESKQHGRGGAACQGEHLATLAALYAMFDAVLRRRTSDKPLALTEMLNGVHKPGRLFALSTSSFFDFSLEFLASQLFVRRPRALRARRAALRYFGAESDFSPAKTKERGQELLVLMGKFSVIAEKDQDVKGQSSQNGRVTNFNVGSRGGAREDGIEEIVMDLIQVHDLDDKDIRPPKYLHESRQKPIKNALAGTGALKTYRQLTQEWALLDVPVPEFDALRDMLILFKAGVDWKVACTKMKQVRSTTTFLPRDVSPGIFCNDVGTNDGADKIIVAVWFGKSRRYLMTGSGSGIDGDCLHGLDSDLRTLRLDGLGVQSSLVCQLQTETQIRAETEAIQKKPNEIPHRLRHVSLTEDEILLKRDLPKTFLRSLTKQEAESLLTLLAAPFVSLSLVLDFFVDKVARCLLDNSLCLILTKLLWQPEAFCDASVDAGDLSVPLKRKPLREDDPRTERDICLGTPHGLMAWELRLRPAVVLRATLRLCKAGLSYSVVPSSSSYVALLLFLVRLATTVEAAALAVLETLYMEEEEGEDPSLSLSEQKRAAHKTHKTMAAAHLDETAEHLAALRKDFLVHAASLLEHWLVEHASGEQHNKTLAPVVFHSHLILIRGNLHRGWPDAIVDAIARKQGASKSPASDAESAMAISPSLAVVAQWMRSASIEEVDVDTAWLMYLLKGCHDAAPAELLPNVYATIQESRSTVLACARRMQRGNEAAKLDGMLERIVRVAQREQSGGELVQAGGGGRARQKTDKWKALGAQPLSCSQSVHSPGWHETADKRTQRYPPSTRFFREVRFPNASRIVITFHEDTELEQDNDYVTFYKDASCTSHWGERRYSGRAGWPGVNGVSALVVPDDHVFVHFRSDASIGERGFHFTAQAPVSEGSARQLLAVHHGANSKPFDADEGMGEQDDGEEDDGEEDDALFACRMALKASDNDYHRARAYLDSNFESLKADGRRERQRLQNMAIGGIYEERKNQLRVSLQTGEVTINGRALIPVPEKVASHEDFRAAMGWGAMFCSTMGSNEEGEWLQIKRRTDGALIDAFAYKTKPAELPNAIRARQELAKLGEELEALEGATSAAHCGSEPELRGVLSRTIDALRDLHIDKKDAAALRTRCLETLAHLGVSRKPNGLCFLVDVANCQALAASLPEQVLPLPAERQLFAHLLHHGALDALAKQRERRREVKGSKAASSSTSGPWILGGLDERALTPGLPPPLLAQEKEGLRFCGRLFQPVSVLQPERTAANEPTDGGNVSAEADAPSREPWMLLFWRKLRYTRAQPGDLQDLLEKLLLFYCPDAQMPLLMYMPAFGDHADGNPGMLYEVGPPSAQPESARPDFIVRALVPCGQQAFSRLSVYSSNKEACLFGHTCYLAQAGSNGEPILPGLRHEGGFLFGILYKPTGELLDPDVDPRTQQRSSLRHVGLRCTRPDVQRTADMKALCSANLSHLSEDELWLHLQYVPPRLVDGLLPGVLTRSFEFWLAGPRTLWGYRMTAALQSRDDEEIHASKSMKSVYRKEWYDGFALHIVLDSSGNAATVRRIRRFDPVRRDFQRDNEPPVLTLLNVLRCPPHSTAQRLLRVLVRLVPQTEMLFWTDAAEPTDGEGCRLHSIQIPRHELTFRPTMVWEPGASDPSLRIMCDELTSMWLVEDCEQPALQKHIQRLRHGVWLTNSEHEYFLLLPLLKLEQRLIPFCKLSTDYHFAYTYAIGRQSHVGFRTPVYSINAHPHAGDPVSYFLYPLHVSGSHLRITSVAAALHLAHLRLMTREYNAVPPLIKAAFKDVPYDDQIEGGLVVEILNFKESSHIAVDGIACIMPLILACLENGFWRTVSIAALQGNSIRTIYMRYVIGIKDVSPECLVEPEHELLLCEWLGMLGRQELIKAELRLLKSDKTSESLPIPPARTAGGEFQRRNRELEPRANGGVFWREWISRCPKILANARAHFLEGPPGPPMKLRIARRETHCIMLAWDQPAAETPSGLWWEAIGTSRPSAAEDLELHNDELCRELPSHNEFTTSEWQKFRVGSLKAGQFIKGCDGQFYKPVLVKIAPVEGYIIEHRVVGTESGDAHVWINTLSELEMVRKGRKGGEKGVEKEKRGEKPVVVWQTTTSFLLGGGDMAEVLQREVSYTFRVIAVSRKGTSDPLEMQDPAKTKTEGIGPVAPNQKDAKEIADRDVTKELPSRSRAATVEGYNQTECWPEALRFTPTTAEPTSSRQQMVNLLKMLQNDGLWQRHVQMGFPYLYGLVTGRCRLRLSETFDKTSEEPEPATAPSEAEQYPGMEHSYEDESADIIPSVVVHPLDLDESRTSSSDPTAAVPAENLSVLKMVLCKILMRSLVDQGDATVENHEGLVALLSVLVEVMQFDAGRKLMHTLPLFPVARNVAALDSTAGLRVDAGQAFTFFQILFRETPRMVALLREEEAGVGKEGGKEGAGEEEGGKEKGGEEEGGKEKGGEVQQTGMLADLRQFSQRFFGDFGTAERAAAAAPTVETVADDDNQEAPGVKQDERAPEGGKEEGGEEEAALTEEQQQVLSRFERATSQKDVYVKLSRHDIRPVNIQVSESANASALLELPRPADARLTLQEVKEPLHAFADEHTEEQARVVEAESQLETPFVSELKNIWSTRFHEDYPKKKDPGDNEYDSRRAPGLPDQRLVESLVVDLEYEQKQKAEDPRPRVQLKGLPQIELEQLSDHVQVIERQAKQSTAPSKPVSDPNAASQALARFHERLVRLSVQLSQTIRKETAAMARGVARVEEIGCRADSGSTTQTLARVEEIGSRADSNSTTQTLLLLSQRAVRPSFERLLASMLSSTQEADLRMVDPELCKRMPELNAEIISCQLRGCRLRLLGACAGGCDDLEATTSKMCMRLLAASFAATCPASRAPTAELLQHSLRKHGSDVLKALGGLIQLTEAIKKLAVELQEVSSFSEEEAGHAAYLLVHGCGFDTGAISVKHEPIENTSPTTAAAFAPTVIPSSVPTNLTTVDADAQATALTSTSGKTSSNPATTATTQTASITISPASWALLAGMHVMSAEELMEAVRCTKRGVCWNGVPLDIGSAISNALPPTKAEIDVLAQKAGTLAASLRTKRWFVKQDGATDDVVRKYGSSESVSFDPRFLAFEFAAKFMLRKEQVEMIKGMAEQWKNGQSCCQQFLMGSGKTTVVAPLLALLLGGGGGSESAPSDGSATAGVSSGARLVVQIVPDALLNMSISVMRNAFGTTIVKPIVSFAFERAAAGADMIKLLRGIQRRLSIACDQGGVVCTTPGAIKSIFLSFLDRMHLEERAPRLFFLPKSALKLEKQQRASVDKIALAMRTRSDEADVIQRILCIFQGATALIDEVDMVLHPLRSELNFPIGKKVELQLMRIPEAESEGAKGGKEEDALDEDNGQLRWLLPIHLFDGVYAALENDPMAELAWRKEEALHHHLEDPANEAPLILKQLQECIEAGSVESSIARLPHLVLLQKTFYEKQMRKPLGRWCCLWYLAQACVQKEVKAAKIAHSGALDLGDGVVTYMTTGEINPGDFDDFMRQIVDKQALALLNLCKLYLVSLLPHVLGKRIRVDFGLLQEQDAIRIQQLEFDEKEQRTGKRENPIREELLEIRRKSRELLAVPFVGKDAPSRAAEFSNPDVVIGLTVAAYRIEGLRERYDMAALVKQERLDFDRSTGEESKRPQWVRFDRWIKLGQERWKRTHGEEEVVPGAAGELALNHIRVGDEKQVAQLSKLLHREPSLICFYLDQYCFRLTQRNVEGGGGYAVEKLSACGMDLGSNLFKRVVGFSGTPSSLVPKDMQEREGGIRVQKGSDANMINVLTSPKYVTLQRLKDIAHPWSVEDLLLWVALASPPFHAFIDTGALVTGFTNEEVARYCLTHGLKWAKAAVFLDPQDRQMVVLKGGGPATPLANVSISLSERFTFYDQVHTTGMDIKQAADARAAVTIGKGMVMRDHTQACWRMRQLGEGQTLTVVLPPEIEKLIDSMSDAAEPPSSAGEIVRPVLASTGIAALTARGAKDKKEEAAAAGESTARPALGLFKLSDKGRDPDAPMATPRKDAPETSRRKKAGMPDEPASTKAAAGPAAATRPDGTFVQDLDSQPATVETKPPAPIELKIDLNAIMRWLICNSLDAEMLMAKQLLIQQAQNVLRKHALSLLLRESHDGGDGGGGGGAAAVGGAGRAAADAPLVPSSLFSLSHSDAPGVLIEELPTLTVKLLALHAELKMEEEKESRTADDGQYAHIKNTRDAIHVLVRNLYAPPAPLRDYGHATPEQIIKATINVLSWSGVVADDVSAIFDPTDGSKAGGMDKNELSNLHQCLKNIHDESTYWYWYIFTRFHFPQKTMQSLFTGSVFTEPSKVVANCRQLSQNREEKGGTQPKNEDKQHGTGEKKEETNEDDTMWKALARVSLSPLEWQLLSVQDKPEGGVELSCEKLAAALAEGRTKFSQAEWDAFGVSSLLTENYLHASGKYFGPRPLAKDLLATLKRKSFEPELGGFTIKQCLKPALKEGGPHADMCVAGGISSYKHLRELFLPVVRRLHPYFDKTVKSCSDMWSTEVEMFLASLAVDEAEAKAMEAKAMRARVGELQAQLTNGTITSEGRKELERQEVQLTQLNDEAVVAAQMAAQADETRNFTTHVASVSFWCTRNLSAYPFLPACGPKALQDVSNTFKKAFTEISDTFKKAFTKTQQDLDKLCKKEEAAKASEVLAKRDEGEGSRWKRPSRVAPAAAAPAAAAIEPSGRGEFADPKRCAELFQGVYRELTSIDANEQLNLKAAGALFEQPAIGSLARVVTDDDEQEQAQAHTQIEVEWQKHRALFRNTDHDRSVLAWVNAEEHLRLMVEFKGCDVSETFCAFATVYEMLRWRLKQNGEEYAHDAMFGWVGYDPHQIGTCFEGALRIRLDYNEDKATAETVGDEQADREEETRESILKEFDLKLSSPLTSNAAGSDENSRYEVKETWYMLRTHLRIGKRDERIGKRDAKGVSAMARDDASIISELMLIQDLVHGGAKRLLALDQRLISTAKERNEELQRKACEAKQLREEREAVYHVGLDLLGWPTPKLNGSGNKIPPQEIYTTRLLESGEVIRGCVRLHREDVTESLLIVPKPKFVASDAENVTKTIALYANLALHFDRMQRLQVEGGVHTRINLDSAEAKFVSSRVLLRLQDPSAVFDSILSSTGATDTRTISEIGDYLITQRMMDALKELRDFESSKGKGSSKSAEERGLNTEMVQEQEQQQQVEKVEQQTEFGDFDDYIIREQLRWCPIFVLRASKRETLLREKLLPFETLKMKGETAHEGVLWPEKNAQEMSLLFSPNWAAREYRGSRTRRVRNIEVLVRVIHSPTSSSLVLVTLEEAEGIMRALDALSERAPRTSLDALSERAPRTSNARAAATKQGSDPIIEMYSLQGVLLSRHGTSGGSTEEQEEQKVPKEQKDEAVTVDLGNRLISEQYLLDNLDKDDESQDPERLLMHFGSMREKTSAKERFLLTATFVRLRFWNSEFIFASSELLALLASLKSLGFTASDVAKVFWELHKGRRRDTSQADILNTDLHALLGNKATEWDVLCELENANKKEENLGSKQSTLEERIKEVRKDDATASASRKPVVREARMRGERSAVERADSSVLTPATAEATPAGLSAHLIAVTPETAGELSMVAGTQLELYASNLLWTRSGSFVTVCPRGCLLRPSSGRWYMELNVHRTSASGGTIFGVVTERFNSASKAVGADEFSWGVGEKGLRHANQNTPISSGDLWQDGDVVGCLIDCKQAELRFYRNGLELQGGVASFLDVRGQIGLCPALTIDCGFLGFFNLGESPFRYPPNMAGVKAVYAFVLEQRTLQHLRMSNAPGKMRALFNRRAVKIEPSGNEWSLKRVPNCWRDPTVSLDGVLLTHAHAD